MRFSVYRDVIASALKSADDVVGAKSVAIIPNIYLNAENGEVRVLAYNGELGIDRKFEANIEEEGKAVLMAKKTYDIIRELPQDDVLIDADTEGNIIIKSLAPDSDIEFKIKGIPPDEVVNVPAIEQGELKGEFSVSEEDLDEGLGRVSFAVSPDEYRPAFSGVCFSIVNDETLELVATDGKQLALTRIPINGTNLPQDHLMVVPSRTTKLLQDILSAGECHIKFSGNLIEFISSDYRVISNLIEESFPNYKSVIPDDTENILEVDMSLLEKAVKRISTIADANLRKVKLELGEDGLVISTSNPAFGSAHEKVPSSYTGKSMAVGFNYTYLLNPAKVLKGETAKFYFSNPVSAVKVIGTETENFLYLAMPMRIDED